MSTWWTADLHLGHQRIIELESRPFSWGRWLLHGHVHWSWKVHGGRRRADHGVGLR